MNKNTESAVPIMATKEFHQLFQWTTIDTVRFPQFAKIRPVLFTNTERSVYLARYYSPRWYRAMSSRKSEQKKKKIKVKDYGISDRPDWLTWHENRNKIQENESSDLFSVSERMLSSVYVYLYINSFFFRCPWNNQILKSSTHDHIQVKLCLMHRVHLIWVSGLVCLVCLCLMVAK